MCAHENYTDMKGGFGTANNSTQSTTGFGGFGAGTPQQSNSGSFGFGVNSSPAFGTPSGGLFGSASQTNNTTTFGSQPSTSLFGNASNTTGPTSTFGSSNVFGGGNSQTITNGSSNPPFSIFSEKEPAGSGTNHFQSITCMPAYSNVSFEELRVQDYNQNRRYGPAAGITGNFGSGSFAAGNNNNNNVFGTQQQSSTFGQSQPASASANSIFGQGTNAQPTIFGSSGNAMSSFGQPQTSGMFGNANTTSSAMGSQNNTNGSIFGTGNGAAQTPFGSNNTATTNTAFGTGNGNPFGGQSNGTGMFGSAPAVSSFGNNNNNNNSAGAKPFSFGASPASGFGQASNTGTVNPFGTTSSSNVGSLFGQGATNNNSSGLFGQQNSGNSTGLNFGSTTATNAGNTTAPFSFGNSSTPVASGTAQKPFSFGTPTNNTNAFGSNQASGTTKPFSFGNSNTTSGNTGNGLFGAQSQNAANAPNAGASLFGSGAFGNSNNIASGNNSGVTAGGSQVATTTPTNLFGKANTNIFNSTNTNNTPSASLFSQQPAINSQPQSLFGNSTANTNSFQQLQPSLQQQNLSLSVANNAYGNNPLFSSLQGSAVNSPGSPGPLATPLNSSSVKKKPATLPHFKIASRSPANPRFLSYKVGANFNSASPNNQRRHIVPAFDEELLLNPEAFSPRSNLKRLIIDREGNDLELLTGGVDIKGFKSGPPTEHDSAKVHVDTAKAQTSGASTQITIKEKPPTSADEKSFKQETQNTAARSEHRKSSEESQNVKERSDESYWSSPPLSSLLDFSKAELSNVQEFKVGRRGFGQISFCVPVDLSSLERIEDLAGGIVLFESKMCTVYPDETLKPPRGKGLNVPAIITLEKCFPLSKDKREPIRDPEHPRFHQHIDRLRKMSETQFVDYLAESGTWIFKVEQF